MRREGKSVALYVSKTIQRCLVIARSRRVKVYVAADGSVPFDDWLGEKLDAVARGRVRERLTRVRLGNLGDSKVLSDGVKEMRLAFGPGYRLYFGEDMNDVVLLIGGDKRSQHADIKKARRYWAHYLSR